jgi:hypothetical protein
MQSTPMAQYLLSRMRDGLQRKAITTCAKWSEQYRVMGKPFPGPWRFDNHPWLREMHNSTAEKNIGQKAAQMGYTELLLNWTFFNIDINRDSCLYVLPTSDDASDFSASRFDPALESSEHLTKLFSDVKNTSMKRAGSATLYIRGSRSKSKLKSIPAGKIAFDEVDEMVQEHLPLAFERASGQVEQQVWMVSTPTVDEYGINNEYRYSTQEHFFFRCPCCSRMIELTFPDSMVITAETHNDSRIKDTHLICTECKGLLKHEEKRLFLASGQHVAACPGMDVRGFHINQLYSPTIHPHQIAISYLKSLSSPVDEQELYNSKLGQTHVVKGAKLNDEDINQCFGEYGKGNQVSGMKLVTIGVDVGSKLHYEVDEWTLEHGIDINTAAHAKVVDAGTVDNFEDIDVLMHKYGANQLVIDADPERRKAFELCQRFYGIARMCHFGNAVSGKQVTLAPDMPMVTVDRTSWLDMALQRFRNRKISIPNDIGHEYTQHLKSTVKVYKKNAEGNIVAKYVKIARDDHFALARCYAEIALLLAAGGATSQNINNIM